MTDIDVPDWVTEAALTAYVNAWDVSVTGAEKCTTSWDDEQIEHARAGIRAALRAALSAWVVPVGVVSDAALERLRTVPDTWDDIFTLDGDVSDMTPLYKML